MDMDRLAGRYRQLQRATVARSALDVIALIFLVAGFAFWAVAFWQLLTPPALLSLLSIQAAVLALAFSLAAPLLLYAGADHAGRAAAPKNAVGYCRLLRHPCRGDLHDLPGRAAD
jgi:hypothetical protein